MNSQQVVKTGRSKIYGQKKKFTAEHADDIFAMRKRLSAEKVANVYCGIITRHDVANLERLHKISD